MGRIALTLGSNGATTSLLPWRKATWATWGSGTSSPYASTCTLSSMSGEGAAPRSLPASARNHSTTFWPFSCTVCRSGASPSPSGPPALPEPPPAAVDAAGFMDPFPAPRQVYSMPMEVSDDHVKGSVASAFHQPFFFPISTGTEGAVNDRAHAKRKHGRAALSPSMTRAGLAATEGKALVRDARNARHNILARGCFVAAGSRLRSPSCRTEGSKSNGFRRAVWRQLMCNTYGCGARGCPTCRAWWPACGPEFSSLCSTNSTRTGCPTFSDAALLPFTSPGQQFVPEMESIKPVPVRKQVRCLPSRCEAW